MPIFPTQDPNTQANLISDQTRRLLAMQDAAYQQRSGFAQNIGAGLGQGVQQGAASAMDDNSLKKRLKAIEQAGGLAPGVTAETAFETLKAGGRLPQKQAPNPLQQSEAAKNQAMADYYASKTPGSKTYVAPTPKPGPNQLSVDKFVADQSKELDNRINPVNAPRGRLLGVLGTNNIKQLRASVTLNDPNMVLQQLDNVSADVASIFQMGSPTEAGMAHNRFDNILTRISGVKSFLSSNPTAINDPALQTKLKSIVKDLSKVSNRILKENIDTEMRRTKTTQDKYPDFKKSAESLRKDLLNSYLLNESDGSFGPEKGSKYDSLIDSVMKPRQ